MMWQTSLLCRAGLFWISLVVSRLSTFLCQWPSWLFGIVFIIWMDAVGNVLREVRQSRVECFAIVVRKRTDQMTAAGFWLCR